MTRHTSPSRPPFGVTLIEMMVALAITTFVILVINQLFNEVVTLVARGTQGGEILQKSSALDERLAFETELQVNDHEAHGQWLSRMVGPGGRLGTGTSTDPPGGFLAIIQHAVDAPLTLDDVLKDPSDPTRLTRVRSDQLTFIYDQDSPLDPAGTKHMPAMAPASDRSFTGDARDSQNAEYVRMWYGHVVQVPQDQDATAYNLNNPSDYEDIDLGALKSANPNALAQDWVLGRHALLLTDSQKPITPSDPWNRPYGPYVRAAAIRANVIGPPFPTRLGNGLCDVANFTLGDLISGNSSGGVSPGPKLLVDMMMFSRSPLLTAAKPLGTTSEMRSWDVSPTHTYFMGGVSDFIVEWAGDVLNETLFQINLPTQIGPDGELDRDPDGRIKWYTSPLYANPVSSPGRSPANPNAPVTYPAPISAFYPPHMNPSLLNSSDRASTAFVWQRKDSPGFTQWPWMIRIRYRLHDRRGEFEGREIVVNTSTGQTQPEKGRWYETIIPVNYQGIEAP